MLIFNNYFVRVCFHSLILLSVHMLIFFFFNYYFYWIAIVLCLKRDSCMMNLLVFEAFSLGFMNCRLIKYLISMLLTFQISRALAGADSKDFMRKLPKFMYDEEKALEKTRKVLTEKIAQLNSAIDDVSAHLRADEGPDESAVNSEEIEASI